MNLNELLQRLRRFPEGLKPDSYIFPTIDADGIANRRALVQEAERRGATNQPASDAPDLDPVEAAIVGDVAELRRKGLNVYAQEMQVYASRLGQIDIEGRVSQIDVSVSDGIGALKRSVHSGQNELYRELYLLKALKAELDAFREDHRLKRTAHYPASHFLGGAVLALILVLEAIANGTFFMESNELGLVGGVGTALVIAFINVGFSFASGRLSTYAAHRRVLPKLFGIMWILAFLVFALAFNLFVGHFREAADTLSWEDATRSAVQFFWDDPFGLDVFNSWILVLVGILFATIAFWDGTRWDDPYPGFGRLWRRWLQAILDYTATSDALMGRLDSEKGAALDQIEAARGDIGDEAQVYLQAAEGRAALSGALPVFLEETERVVNLLLSRYRELNRAKRSSPAPEYFSSQYRYRDEDKATAQDLNLDATLGREKLAARIERADQKLVTGAAALQAAHQEGIVAYRQIAAIFQEIAEHGITAQPQRHLATRLEAKASGQAGQSEHGHAA